MVRIVDLQEVNAVAIDSSDYLVISHLNADAGTYGTARVAAGQFFQFLNGPPPSLTNTDELTEGSTNLYFTTARARNSISVTGSLSYNSTTGVISYTQPTNVSTFTNNAGYITADDALDSSEVIALIDTTYVQARQDYQYSSLTGIPTNVSAFANDAGYLTDADTLDSAEAIQLIDSAYVRLRQDYRYSSLTGSPTNVSAFANDAGYVTAAEGLDSQEAIALIDSAHVQARQDYRYSSLTGAPTDVSTFANDAGYITANDALDSSEVIALIDSAYVQARVGEVGIDSDAIISLIDSPYVQARANESYITGITDPKYVSLEGDSMTGTLWVDGDIYASGNVTGFASFSDITLKENIVQIESSLDKVLNLTGYTFNYIGNSERVPGLIAQEVESQLPEAVYETHGGKKAIHYGNMMALVIEAIKELKADLDEVKERLK